MNCDLIRRASRLGFGCASLGSRVGARRGLRAMARAFDAGVTWYDFAPSYGAGEAETIGGQFVAGRQRDSVIICTKFGLLPSRQRLLSRLAGPVARSAVRAAPGLRTIVGRMRTGVQPVALDPASMRTSLENSLRRLGTDHVDVFALHDPDPRHMGNPELGEVLARLSGEGKFRVLGIAGSPAAAAAAIAARLPVAVVQLPHRRPGIGGGEEILASGHGYRVTHSVYGHPPLIGLLAKRLDGDATLRHLLAEAGYRGTSRQIAAACLLDRALLANPAGTVLVSMFEPGHLAFNLDRVRTEREAGDGDREARMRALGSVDAGLFRHTN